MKQNLYTKSSAVLITLMGIFFAGLLPADELPADFPKITSKIYKPEALADGYIFLAVASDIEGVGYYVMILNNDGTPVWYKKVHDEIYDFKVQPSGQMSFGEFVKVHSWTGGGDAIHPIYNDDYNEVEVITGKNGYVAESHDFQLLPNGNVLQIGYYKEEVDMSKLVPGGHPAALVSGGIIQELDWQRNVVFQWRSWDNYSMSDYFIPYQNDPAAKAAVINAFHLNTINQDIDGNLFVGTPQWTKKISRQTGDIMWHLGGDENQFSFVGATLAEGKAHFGGHAFHRLDNGNVLIYDNGNRPGTVSSKVHEYTLDEVNKVATRVWSYEPSPKISAWHRGNAQRLANGNTFIGWGGASGKVIPTCTEVNPAKEKVMELFFDDPRIESYRAFKFTYPPQIKAIEVTEYELASGNSYGFGDTGVTIDVINRTGDGYNELTVTREPYAPLFPAFAGQSPIVLPVRIKTTQSGITSIQARIIFNADSFGFKDPGNLTVYHREYSGQGLFQPVNTSYNPVTKELRADMAMFGEYIFGYPDLVETPYMPILKQVEDYRGEQPHEVIAPPKAQAGTTYSVNQDRSILLSWSPKGKAVSYQMEIATDSEFSHVILSEGYLTDARYIWADAADHTTYYYRVKTCNYGGCSDFAVGSFKTEPPMIQVTVPNGGQWWKRGLKYYVQWKDNLAEDVTLELYKGDVFVSTLGTTTIHGAINWEIPVDQPAGNDYTIKAKSTINGSLFDVSDGPFIIYDGSNALGDFNLDGDIKLDDFAVITQQWLKTAVAHIADLNSDGKVDTADLTILIQNWAK